MDWNFAIYRIQVCSIDKWFWNGCSSSSVCSTCFFLFFLDLNSKRPLLVLKLQKEICINFHGYFFKSYVVFFLLDIFPTTLSSDRSINCWGWEVNFFTFFSYYYLIRGVVIICCFHCSLSNIVSCCDLICSLPLLELFILFTISNIVIFSVCGVMFSHLITISIKEWILISFNNKWLFRNYNIGIIGQQPLNSKA